jgi:hypothetical protein
MDIASFLSQNDGMVGVGTSDFVNDQTVPINDAYVRLFHRHIKSSKIVHGSFCSCNGADPIGLLRRAANHYPMLKKSSPPSRPNF